MKKSYYFDELSASYDAEIQDLLNDSEGNSALKARLGEKRRELKSILPMIEFAPEMVVPVFYDAFSFANGGAMAAAIMCEPDEGDFPSWDDIRACIKIEAWAAPYVTAVLAEPAGEGFMVAAACLEFIRKTDRGAQPVALKKDDDDADDGEAGDRGCSDDDGDDEDRDLGEAGDDWLGEQGFDSLKS